MTLGGEGLPVSFSLPAEGRPTRLADPRPRYWEVAVLLGSGDVELKAGFLVPVYARREEDAAKPCETGPGDDS